MDFILNLDAIQSSFAIDWDSDVGNFFVRDAMKQVRGIRLHDLVDKLRYEQLARRVMDILHGEQFPVRYVESLTAAKVHALHPQLPGVKLFVSSGMTRSEGLSDFKYVVTADGDNPLMLGVQLQAHRLKVFVEMDSKAKAEKAANALWQPSIGNRIWFDFAGVKSGSNEFPKSPKIFDQYSRVFFYRYVQLRSASPKSLVEIIVGFIRLIRDNEPAIRQQLETAL